MDIKTEFAEILKRLETKFPNYENVDYIETIEFAISQFKRLSNDNSIVEFTADEKNWIKKCCYEMLDRVELGAIGGIKQYSENGYSFSLDGSSISQALMSEIVPKVGYAK